MLALRAPHAFDGERVLPGGALVLVRGGKIVRIENAAADVPAGYALLDVPNATVLPGLLNTHVHLCGDSGMDALDRLPGFSDEALDTVIDTALAQQLATGVTTVRDLGDRRWAVLERRNRATANNPAPTILASGPPITSVQGHCWAMGGEASGIDSLRQAIADRVDRQVDIVKIMASGGAMTPGTDVGACQFADEELRFAVDESHRAGLAITAHAHALIAVRQAIDAGVDGIEHCTCVGPNGLEMPDDVLQLLAERRIAVCPTLGNVPGATPPPRVQEFLVRYNMTESDRINAFARAHAAGVLIISGDDAGIGPGKRHGVGPEPVIQLQQGGVPTPDALATATSIAADVCGVGATKGRLRAGHDADVLLVYGDATADTTALRSVAAVVVAGAIVIDNADGRAVAP